MQPKHLVLAAVIVSLLLVDSQVFAQRGRGGGGGGSRGGGGPGGGIGGGGNRGGGPGGGGERGGGGIGGPGGAGPHGGGGRQNPGGLGGGLSDRNEPGRTPGGSAAMGPFGHEPTSPHGMPPGAKSGSGPRPGAGGLGGPASGAGVRPGAGAGGAASGIGVRPGLGAGQAGGPASGIGVRPGLGAGQAGRPASGIGVRPGIGAGDIGATGEAAARRATGTYYASSAALAEQSAAFRGVAAAAYPVYGAAMYANYANAWVPRNLTAVSVYGNPGYRAVAAQLGLATTAIPYDYGGNVVAQTNAVYVNGDAAGTPQEYANQATQLANSGQSAQPDQESQWLPLGVFAVVERDQTSSDDIFQLAVNSQGIIRGNYHNVRSDQVEALSGSVDKMTQRAAWTIGTDQNPVYEAGIANLTKEATPLLVHIGDGQTRQMSLIRLPQPNQ